MKAAKGWKLYVPLICIGLLVACVRASPTQDPVVALAEYNTVVSHYNQIKLGMTYEDITQIIGAAGVDFYTLTPSAEDIPSIPQLPPGTLWSFNQGGCEIRVAMFRQNSTIDNKYFQCPLSYKIPKANARTTNSKYDQVNTGMKYDEVVSVLGSPGMLFWSVEIFIISPVRSDIYFWWLGDKQDVSSPYCSLKFRDGVLEVNMGCH